MTTSDVYYLVGYGDKARIWSVHKAEYIKSDSVPEGAEVTQLETAEGMSDEAYLIKTLKFYGWPLGDLANLDDKIDYMLKEEKDYLVKVLLLYAMGIDIPERALEPFMRIKDTLSKASKEDVTKLLRNA